MSAGVARHSRPELSGGGGEVAGGDGFAGGPAPPHLKRAGPVMQQLGALVGAKHAGQLMPVQVAVGLLGGGER
ncbi:MAG: hypothetical protein ACRDZ2_08380, partial [Ilumatobacteraceae bacterium]